MKKVAYIMLFATSCVSAFIISILMLCVVVFAVKGQPDNAFISAVGILPLWWIGYSALLFAKKGGLLNA